MRILIAGFCLHFFIAGNTSVIIDKLNKLLSELKVVATIFRWCLNWDYHG